MQRKEKSFTEMKSLDQRIVLEALKLLISTDVHQSLADGISGVSLESISEEKAKENLKLCLDDILEKNLLQFKDHLKNDKRFKELNEQWQQEGEITACEDSSIRWHFTKTCLKLLLLLQAAIKDATRTFNESMKDKQMKELTPNQAPPLSPDSLSVEQQKTVSTIFQFIVCLGIVPCLQDGVGVAVQLRTGFGHLLTSESCISEVDDIEKQYRLVLCAQVFSKCCRTSCLGSLILFKHLGDVLAVLLQVCFGYPKNQADSKLKDHVCIKHGTASSISQSSEELKKTTSTPLPLAAEQTEIEVSLGKEVFLPPTSEHLVPGSSPHPTEAMHKTLQGSSDVREPQETKHGTSSSASLSSQTDLDTSTASDHQVCSTKVDHRVEKIRSEHLHCEAFLKTVLKRVYQPLLVRELLLLQGRIGSSEDKAQSGKRTSGSTPVWLRAMCGKLLSEVLMKPKGVLHVLNGMMEGNLANGPDSSSDIEWKKCDAIAQVISHCPMKSSSVEQYYKHIAPQILELINIKDEVIGRHYLRVSCSSLSNMFHKHEELTQKYLIKPLLEPLSRLTCKESDLISGGTISSESEMTSCIECIHKVFLSGLEPDSEVLVCLYPLIHVLFCLYCFVYEGVYHIKLLCRDLLVHCCKQSSVSVAIHALNYCLFGNVTLDVKSKHNFQVMDGTVLFTAGDCGGVRAVSRGKDFDSNEEMVGEKLETRIGCMVDILTDLQECGLAGEFFIDMLKQLTTIIHSQIGQVTTVKLPSADPARALLDLETEQQEEASLFIKQLTILNILSAVCEVLGPSCLQSTAHVLDFVKVTLERGIEICTNTQDEEFNEFESETILMALGLLTAVMTGALQITELDKAKMKTLLPLLEELSTKHPDSSVQEMAANLRIAIATHGASWSDDIVKTATDFMHQLKKKKPNSAADKNNVEKRPEIEIIKSIDAEISDNKNKVAENERVQKISETSERVKEENNIATILTKSGKTSSLADTPFQQAMREVKDPLLPVRGHGIIALTKLLRNRDADALQKQEKILEIFLSNLSDSDSYLYLAAVNGLASLADRFSDVVIHRLAEEYADFDGQRLKSAEDRMKLGECILRASRNLGDMIPKYKDVLLNSLLSGAKAADPLVRASSLSNLGEVCRLLRFSIGNVVHEVFNCCSSLLKTDSDAEVRKAAALMITLLLQGLGKDAMKVLDSLLRDLYRLLKLVMKTEKEDTVKLHVITALNELDSIMKGFLFPPQKLEKKITVLEAP